MRSVQYKMKRRRCSTTSCRVSKTLDDVTRQQLKRQAARPTRTSIEVLLLYFWWAHLRIKPTYKEPLVIVGEGAPKRSWESDNNALVSDNKRSSVGAVPSTVAWLPVSTVESCVRTGLQNKVSCPRNKGNDKVRDDRLQQLVRKPTRSSFLAKPLNSTEHANEQ